MHKEERFLRIALNAIVAQDYHSIELIIPEICSTDDSENIGQEYARKYDWITFRRYENSAGPARSFSYVLNASSGEFYVGRRP